VKDFIQGESDSEAHEKCLTDCPSNFQFYTITININEYKLYGGQNECENYYTPNNSYLIITKS
jgi:hypothetical protein